jgi:hypothetical protein
MRQVLTILLVWILSASAQALVLDSSPDMLVPEEAASRLHKLSNSPSLWWSFFVYQGGAGGLQRARQFCQAVLQEREDLVEHPCLRETPGATRVLQEWAQDVIWREPLASVADLRAALDDAKTQMTFVTDAGLRQRMEDPLRTVEDLATRMRAVRSLTLERREGFYFDGQTGRWVVAVLHAQAPDGVAASKSLFERFRSDCSKRNDCESWFWVGPHSEALRDRGRVALDLKTAGTTGLVLLTLLAVFLILSGTWRFVFLVPPLVVGALVGALITYWIYGSVHALTLSFSLGLVGMVINFGAHALFRSQEHRVWSINLVGLFVALAVLGCVLVSQVPLLRQLAVFAGIAILSSYLIYVVFFAWAGGIMQSDPWEFRFPEIGFMALLSIGLALFGIYSFVVRSADLSLAALDVEQDQTLAITRWVRANLSEQGQVLDVATARDLKELVQQTERRRQWAVSQRIDMIGPDTFLPDVEVADVNAATWAEVRDGKRFATFPEDKKIFASFLRGISEQPESFESRMSQAPAYLRLVWSQGQASFLWSPLTEKDRTRIVATFGALDARDFFTFSQGQMRRHARWMLPIAVAIVAIILLIALRSPVAAGLAMMPFGVSAGAYFLAVQVGLLQFNFVGLISVLFLFGTSVHYGIFAMTALRAGRESVQQAVDSGLTVAFLSSLVLVFPLTLASHPLLQQLGFGLTAGLIGAFLGAAFLVPWSWRWVRLS